MASLTNMNTSATYWQARQIANNNGKKVVSLSSLDAYKMAGNRGAFWARELYITGVPFKNDGKDIKDDSTKITLPASDLKKAHESSKNGIYGREGILLFTDAKDFSDSKDYKVMQDPSISVVENPVLAFGGAGKVDEQTKIAVEVSPEELAKLDENQKRFNYLNKGIRPFVRGVLDDYGRRLVLGYYGPLGRVGVLLEGTDLKQFVLELEQKIAELTKEMKTHGVAEKDIETMLAPMKKILAAAKE